MRLFKQILTKNECYTLGRKIVPLGIMWHSTGANNPNLRRYVQPDDGILGVNSLGNHWNQPRPEGIQICCHAFIGKDAEGAVATYQCLPWDWRGWHAAGKANDTHISFEICEDNLNDADYFNKVYKEGCELTAYLCKMFNLDPLADGVVICHSEGYKRGVASNHADVMHWFKRYGKTMDDVRRDVKALMGNSDAAAPAESDNMYRVQCGAFSKKSNAEGLADKLKSEGFPTYITRVDDMYKVQCGAFKDKSNADDLLATLKKKGYAAYVTTGVDTTAKPVDKIKPGDRVKIKAGATSYEGNKMLSYVYAKEYSVDEVRGDRALLDKKGLCTAFNAKDLIKI